MTDPAGPGAFTDVDEAVGAEWESETTPYERVREVVSHAYGAVSAQRVADDARTSSKTARKHLETLADEGFVATEPGAHGGTRYRRSAESLVVEQAADILDEYSTEELVERVSELRERLGAFRAEYGVDSPEELTVDRTNQALSGDDVAANGLDTDERREWQRTRRNLAFANAALSIANAERFVTDDSGPTEGSVPVQ